MTLRFKPMAQTDLRALRLWSLQHWGPVQTRDYVVGLKQAFALLEARPDLGRPRDLIVPTLRSWKYNLHIVFYVKIPVGISIVRVLHERQNAAALDFAALLES